MQRITLIAVLAGVIALASSAAAQVVVDMPPPPARKSSAELAGGGSAAPAGTHVDAGWLALNRYVGAQISPIITTAPAGGPLAYAYGLSARYRSIGWDSWHGGWYGGPGWWGYPIFIHPKHPVFPGHPHCPPDFFSGSFKHSSSKWNIRLRF